MSVVISRDAWSGFQRWEPPQVGDAVPAGPLPATAVEHPTVSDLEALERQARQEGHALGHAEGTALAQQQARARMAQLDALYASAARPLAALDTATEQELAQLAMVMAQRIVAHELRVAPERIAQIVQQAAAALPSATRELRVRLHPDDVALLRELDAAQTHWQLVADATISRGGCLLEAERSRLDARLETRLAALIDAALGDDGVAPA